MEPAITSLLDPAAIGILMTGLLLGMRHGIDWDHIAAITDITSTAAAAGSAESAHGDQHRTISGDHHGHGGAAEMRAHDTGPGTATLAPMATMPAVRPASFWPRPGRGRPTRHALRARPRRGRDRPRARRAVARGDPPDWLDPIMGRIVGVTLVALGLWVLFSVYRYARGGTSFRLRSRWMLVFDGTATAGGRSRPGCTATSTSSRSR